ncbi:unnamed protein product [Caenorhabditis sp. 36 PRJEB53466]|nr:unnamed protein product [Caenorhabditis sp. 36 PRJEB53466]
MMEMEAERSVESNHQHKKMDTVKSQVASVKAIMIENVDRILERGEQLDRIERRSEQLNETTANFKITSRKVQRKFCLLNANGVIMIQSHVFHSPKYHLVFANQNEARLDFDVCRHVTIFGHQWRLISFAEFERIGPDGHYVC